MAKTLSQKNIGAWGIDPGLAATGYAVVEALIKGGNLSDWGSIKTSSKKTQPLRLQEIYSEIDGLINKWSPSLLVIPDFSPVLISLRVSN
jgi:Holliday junction resolvasome RuvABC endonuclease subunit